MQILPQTLLPGLQFGAPLADAGFDATTIGFAGVAGLGVIGVLAGLAQFVCTDSAPELSWHLPLTSSL